MLELALEPSGLKEVEELAVKMPWEVLEKRIQRLDLLSGFGLHLSWHRGLCCGCFRYCPAEASAHLHSSSCNNLWVGRLGRLPWMAQ